MLLVFSRSPACKRIDAVERNRVLRTARPFATIYTNRNPGTSCRVATPRRPAGSPNCFLSKIRTVVNLVNNIFITVARGRVSATANAFARPGRNPTSLSGPGEADHCRAVRTADISPLSVVQRPAGTTGAGAHRRGAASPLSALRSDPNPRPGISRTQSQQGDIASTGQDLRPAGSKDQAGSVVRQRSGAPPRTSSSHRGAMTGAHDISRSRFFDLRRGCGQGASFTSGTLRLMTTEFLRPRSVACPAPEPPSTVAVALQSWPVRLVTGGSCR